MKLRRARYAGACYGVQRALDLVESALGSTPGPVSTLGPLIHNPSVVADLASRGVRPVDSVAAAGHGTLVIRTHGVAPARRAEAQRRGLTVLDATCPHVSKVQAAASRLSAAGYLVLVVGERGHPEVEAISAYAGPGVLVVQRPEQLPDLPSDTRIGVVTQTTQSPAALQDIVAALTARGFQPQVEDTICFATRQRQVAASELAGSVDVMLVVGGRNSSNTTRLAELCQAVCPRTWHLEEPQELQADWFTQAETIGITAGASTPENQIAAVVARLLELFPSLEMDTAL